MEENVSTEATSAVPAKFEGNLVASLAASGLTDGIADVGALMPAWVEFEAGDRICKKGDAADRLWVIVAGQVAVRAGDETVKVRERGEIIGEQALLGNGHRGAEMLVHRGPAKLIEIHRSAIEKHPEAAAVWRNIARVVSTKLDEATAERAQMASEAKRYRGQLRKWVGAHALGEEALYPEEVSAGQRRLRAVVWFSDVVGFSKFSAEMMPERAAAFVQDFLGRQERAIAKSGGVIDKFMGDAVMAFWIVRGDDEHACRSALTAAQESLASVSAIQIGATALKIRVGLHIGDVSAGNFGTDGRAQYTIIGREVNVAARLEQSHDSKIGWIRVSRAFHEALPAFMRGALPVSAQVQAKNMGVIETYATEPEGEVR